MLPGLRTQHLKQISMCYRRLANSPHVPGDLPTCGCAPITTEGSAEGVACIWTCLLLIRILCALVSDSGTFSYAAIRFKLHFVSRRMFALLSHSGFSNGSPELDIEAWMFFWRRRFGASASKTSLLNSGADDATQLRTIDSHVSRLLMKHQPRCFSCEFLSMCFELSCP